MAKKGQVERVYILLQQRENLSQTKRRARCNTELNSK